MIAVMSTELIDRLRSYPYRTREEPDGSTVFQRDERVRSLFVVERGLIELHRYNEVGNVLVLQRAGSGSILAEASIYSDRYHCDAVAVEPSRLLVFSKSKIIEAMSDDPRLAQLWGAYLSSAIQNARQRAEILSRRTVAERLDGWLAMNGLAMPSKGQWKYVATEIGVTSEALYRELAKRRRKPID